jgi:hypothetical protein
VSDDAANFRWPGLAVLALAIAAVLLIAAIQCAYHARIYLAGNSGQNESPEPWRIGRSDHDYKLGLAWTKWTQRVYHYGIVALLAGLALAVASYHATGVRGILQWFALGLAFAACVGEAGWIAAQSLRSRPRKKGYKFKVRDAGGSAYWVELTKINEDTTTRDGQRSVGAVFKITAGSGSPEHEDANQNAVLIGDNDKTYVVNTQEENNGQEETKGEGNTNGLNQVAQDLSAKTVTFQLPDGVKVTEVQWSAASGYRHPVRWKVSATRRLPYHRTAGGDRRSVTAKPDG